MVQALLEPKNGSRRSWTEAEIITWVREGNLRLPAGKITLVEAPLSVSNLLLADGALDVRWGGLCQRFVFECKALSTPKSVETAAAHARLFAGLTSLSPLVIVPYLAEERLRFLEQSGVSGLDLAGNGVILASGFALWRSGQPNPFKTSLSPRNVFRGTSSLLARCFLLRPGFASLTALGEYAVRRLSDGSQPALAKSTVSKVVHSLEEEQIVRREQSRLVVTDAARLMEELRTNYRPSSGARLVGKTALSPEAVWHALETVAEGQSIHPVATGLGSAAYYRALSGPDILSVYVPDLEEAASALRLQPTHVFPNIEIIAEKNAPFYYDARRTVGAVWASPVQTWLELAAGGPREREAAQRLENALAQSRGEQLP